MGIEKCREIKLVGNHVQSRQAAKLDGGEIKAKSLCMPVPDRLALARLEKKD